MNVSTKTDLPKRTQSISRILANFSLVLVILLPVSTAIYWAIADVGSLALRVNLPREAVIGELHTWQRLAGCLLTETYLGLFLAGLWQARNCFLQLAKNNLFTAYEAECLKRFSVWSWVSVLAELIAKTITSSILTLENTDHSRHLIMNVNSDQALLVFFTALVWLMADIQTEVNESAFSKSPITKNHHPRT